MFRQAIFKNFNFTIENVPSNIFISDFSSNVNVEEEKLIEVKLNLKIKIRCLQIITIFILQDITTFSTI